MAGLDQTYVTWMVALGLGLLIGAERERHKGAGPGREPAGIRTFTITALLGAAAMKVGGPLVLGIVAAGVIGFVGIAYFKSRADDPGLTTEVALVMTLMLGAMAVADAMTASALAVVVTILLAVREPMHHFVRDTLTAREMRSGLILAAATLVVWPVLPNRFMGPLTALNPHAVWAVVVLIMAIGAAGHVAVRAMGSRLGLPLAGFLSGFVSSSATIASMGAKAANQPALTTPAVAAAIFSTVATVVQTAVVVGATSPPTLRALAVPLALAGLVSVVYGVLFAVRLRDGTSAEVADEGEAFSVQSALSLAALLAGVLVLVAASRAWFGHRGVMLAAGLAGFADAQSAAVSVAAQAAAETMSPREACVPILVGLSTNTITKIVLAVSSGTRKFALMVVPGLLFVLAAAWLGLWWSPA